MSSAISKRRDLQSVLPNDIFQDIILPHLLSQHLHKLLIDPDPPEWHAFYVLPLVSRLWHYTCQSLFSSLFGIKRRSDGRQTQEVEDSEDSDGSTNSDDYDPSSVLEYAISTWKRARRPASKTALSHQHSRSTLLSDKSLVRVYTCLALGKMSLNEDILMPLGAFSSDVQDDTSMDPTYRNAWDEDYEEELDGGLRRTSMDEASIHRCLMPFECAQRLCDLVVPKSLAYIAAEYMAQVLPLYYSLPLLTKYTRDLQFNVEREYDLGLVHCSGWVLRTFRRLEATDGLVRAMMSFGVLVRSFWDESDVPTEAIKLTGIVGVLDDVVRADWGTDTVGIRKRASVLIRRWTAVL